MPIYEFTCAACGTAFEVTRSFSQATDPATCPRCGGEGRREYSLFASEGRGKVRVPEKEALRESAAPSATASRSPRPAPERAGRKQGTKAERSTATTAKRQATPGRRPTTKKG